MTKFEEYHHKYQAIRMEMQDGILEITFHTDGGPLQWGGVPHEEFPSAFHDIASDPDNRVVIMTGTGDVFSGPPGTPESRPKRAPGEWDKTYWEGKHLLWNLLDIEVPMISAINGPALRHSELPLLCDIVLAAEEASFQDSGHFINGLVPGDGMHIVYPLLLGLNRGRYFLLTGQTIGSAQALELGLISEVLPRPDLLPRARALAQELARQSDLVLRYTRVSMTQYIKRLMHDILGYGLALEGLGSADQLDKSEISRTLLFNQPDVQVFLLSCLDMANGLAPPPRKKSMGWAVPPGAEQPNPYYIFARQRRARSKHKCCGTGYPCST